MKNKPKKVFIMTTPRSGSTLLGQQLGINTRIFHIGEASYWDILPMGNIRCSCGNFKCNFLSELTPEIQSKHLARPLLKAWQIIDNKYWRDKKIAEGSVFEYQKIKIVPRSLDYWLSRCPQALDDIIKVYSNHTPKDVFVDNTKLHLIGERLTNLPDWKIVVLLRDPRGVMCSYKLAGISKKDFRKAESVLPYLDDFMDSINKVLGKSSVTLVRYEDFCINPRMVLKELCNFIEVPYESNMSELFTTNKEFRGHVIKGNRLLKAKQIKNILEDKKWKTELTDNELNTLYRNENLILSYRKLGYTFD